MLVSQVYFHENKHAFHLYLKVDFRCGNLLLSTIPLEVLKSKFPKTIMTLNHAYITSAFEGEKYLNSLANKIIAIKELHVYFYPDFILQEQRLKLDIVDDIINKSENLPIYTRTHYCRFSFPVEFFIMSSMFLSKKKLILRTAEEISVNEFMTYLLTSNMRIDFSMLDDSLSSYYKIFEEGVLEYLLLLNSRQELRMVVSL
jgi:hypothetical protein